ncbi:MAG TPA: hypothetical protein VHS57_02950 [Acidimicrobiales bacterium]|nr:hypothetical protein [Acidimicrobiales bacterium]
MLGRAAAARAAAAPRDRAALSGAADEGAPIEIPKDVLDRVSSLCRALPEVTVRVDASA